MFKHSSSLAGCFLVFCLLIFSTSLFAQKSNISATENAYRANNKGVSLLEQFKFDEAEKQFRNALSLAPNLKLAQINLVIALFNAKKFDEAKTLANKYLQTEKDSLQAFYILGLIGRAENNLDEALTNFRRVLQFDPNDVGANVNIGQILALKREYVEAIKVLEVAYQAESFNLTAIYNLATSLQRSGERERAAELLKKFQVLRDTFAGVNIGLNYLEQGRYAEALASTGAEKELVSLARPQVRFVEVTSTIFSKNENVSAKSATLFDYDGDGKLDLAVAKGGTIQLFRNVNGKLVDVTANSGDLANNYQYISNSIVAGDYDNDLKPDLLAVRVDGFTLYQNQGNGKFKEVTKAAGLPIHQPNDQTLIGSFASAWVDFDHDGDIDIFAPGGFDFGKKTALPNKLFRNNNDGTFTDVSEIAQIADKPKAAAVVPTDFNNTRDIDLLVVGEDKTFLHSNLRNDTFKDVAAEVGIDAGGSSAAAADVNKDGFTDFFIGRDDGESRLFLSNGKGKFIKSKITPKKLSANSSQFLDFDNDGLIDLITSSLFGTRIWRNLGNRWVEFKNPVSLDGAIQILSGDLDNDGDLDLILVSPSGKIKIFRNDGGNQNNAETLNLQGRVSNKSGIGARVMMRSGSLSQQLESYSASPMPAPSQVHFGLRKREKSDSIRILWSSGIVQSETDFAVKAKQINILEVDRKPASCPYLYTWDGEKFVFITDFLGGGEMANWAGKGVFNYPDSDEFVRIAPDKLKAKNGFYELRVTNELEEVMYLDKVKLIVIEHDANSEVYPNEGLAKSENSKESLYEVRNTTTPISATNSKGENVTAKIKDLDRIFYDDFKTLPIRGYAETHSLTLNLDDKKGYNGRTILLLTGWTDYAFSSDNLNASQSGKSLSLPYLQVKNTKGEWQTVIDSIGISVGRPQTVPVDLTGKFLSDSREVRIVTNFRTYWDKIAVDSSEKGADLKTIEIEPTVANLQERGFGKETKFGGMIVPDYDKVSFESPWKNFAGRFTRIGDVKSLLSKIDDIFVVAKAGDEFVLKFKELPTLPKGKTYTFLLFADGYSKEADINSGSPDAVHPFPFKGMKKYPYGADESFPMTDEKRRIYDETLTRFSRGGLAGF
jgi:tetratricopeptide (TPR) repeat protein